MIDCSRPSDRWWPPLTEVARVVPALPHLFEPARVIVSPRRQMDVPDRPGAPSSDFEGCVS